MVQHEVGQLTELALGHRVQLKIIDATKRPQECIIFGRRSALGSSVTNLITNAIAYSPQGGTVTVKLEDEDGQFTMKVKDKGPGIDPQYHSRIFERFFRVDPGRSRELGGSGLGLSIVRNTMRAHGGDVTVKSELGKGSTFKLRLPLELSATMRKKKKTQKQLVNRARLTAQVREDGA